MKSIWDQIGWGLLNIVVLVGTLVLVTACDGEELVDDTGATEFVTEEGPSDPEIETEEIIEEAEEEEEELDPNYCEAKGIQFSRNKKVLSAHNDSGEELWSVTHRRKIVGGIFIYPYSCDVLVMTDRKKKVYAYRFDGTRYMRKTFRSAVKFAPTLNPYTSDLLLIIGDKKLHAYTTEGRKRWGKETSGKFRYAPVLNPGKRRYRRGHRQETDRASRPRRSPDLLDAVGAKNRRFPQHHRKRRD